jgi:putative aldouronate transport system substrate-binding protein
MQGVNVLWIRGDWLKNLNLTPPKTMQELLALSRAFAKDDPDGDGQDNTFGMGLSQYLFDNVGDGGPFFNGYHAYPNMWYPDSSGSLIYGGVQPDVKDALAALQAMYADGQLDMEFIVKDSGKLADDVVAGKFGMMFGSWWNPAWPFQSHKEFDPASDWKPFDAPSADGEKVTRDAGFHVGQWYVVRKGFEHPEALVKILNFWFEKGWGETQEYSKYFDKPDGTAAQKLSPVVAWPAVDERARHITHALNTDSDAFLNPEEKIYYDHILEYLDDGDLTRYNYYGNYGPDSALFIHDDIMAGNRLMITSFYGAPTETMTTRSTFLDKLKSETYTTIIMGKSLDEFDRFVEEWKSVGGDDITNEVNEWYRQRQ